jgi:hypothetical protein
MNASLGRAKLGGSPTYSLLAGDKYLDLLLGKLGARGVRLAGKAGPAIGGIAGSLIAGRVGGGVGAAVGEGLGADIGKSLYSASRDLSSIGSWTKPAPAAPICTATSF